jgi:hypothetical protein
MRNEKNLQFYQRFIFIMTQVVKFLIVLCLYLFTEKDNL